MAPKRQNDSGASDELSGRERKKQKTAIARTIAVQDVGSSSGNALAGPSKSVRFDSMKGLPGALDVEKFAEARAFEVNAMHEAMQNARSNSTQRAWQQLPRHLRRRAASHDVRRVPLRLRDKARAEMDPARRKALGRNNPKHGKYKKVRRTIDFLRRQRDKTWLETHIWHSKRMHMENMWGYRLAKTPTEKSFRPSHRASVHGSILHDASYFATIELKGPEDLLRMILDSCCDCQGPSPGAMSRFVTGARAMETYIYDYNKYPYNLIGPATILWQASFTEGQSSTTQKGSGKGKGREKANPPPNDAQKRTLIVWVRVHPSVTEQAHEALRISASFALDAAKKAERIVEVEIADLREHFNMFEIMGPKSTQIIKGALRPVDYKREEVKKFWTSMSRIQTAGSVPRGMVVGFTVHDPRLSFPPKNAKLEIDNGTNLTPSSTVYPSANIAQSEIWDENTRMSLRKPRYKKKDLDQRRSKNLVPGTPLKSERNDDRIPVLLIQRSVENGALSQTPGVPRLSTTTALHGWTLVVPQGWGMPFLSSLIYTGTRVGGQRERQTQAFEAGCAYFPRDFPACEAYDDYADEKEGEDRAAWERKPPAKRPNYDKLGTRSPWRPDWPVVLGIEKAPEPQELEDFVDTQRDAMAIDGAATAPAPGAAAPSGENAKVEPWLLRGPDVSTLVADISKVLDPAAGLLVHVNQARAKRKLDPLHAGLRAEDLLQGALVQVSVVLCGRGCPVDLAAIYRVQDKEALMWLGAEAKRKRRSLVEGGPDETELSQVPPSSDDIVGYVTTGSYSLSLGEGHAIGAVPLSHYLELRKQADKLCVDSRPLVKLRNRDETVCRAAFLQLLH
ncbi:POP1-domain-containing protein [Daedaleopsis nitida]|nr:POP1-domain-containing protein [Daedaleopsis nitida]